ncbi:MAG: hypothetical protein ACOYJS_05420 [Acutalibacteraceae bacterium]
MKKSLLIFISLLLILPLCACTAEDLSPQNGANKDVSSTATNTVSKTVSSRNTTSTVSSVNNSGTSSVPHNTSSSNSNNSSAQTGNTSKNNSSENNIPHESALKIKDPNGLKEKIEKIAEKLPQGFDKLSSNNGEEPAFGKDYGGFEYSGTFVDLVLEGDFLYAIFASPDMLVIYNTKTLELVNTYLLPSKPAEIQLIDKGIYISFPELKFIFGFDKVSMEFIKIIDLPHTVTSFVIDGDRVYYATDGAAAQVVCANLATKETSPILALNNQQVEPKLFSSPKLLLNKEKGLLYIGESGSVDSKLYYYNLSDLSYHSHYAYNGFGLNNHKRTMFLVGNSLFWAERSFDAGNASKITYEYGVNNYGNLCFANKDFVITANGIFDTETGEFGVNLQHAEYLAVSENNSLIVVFDDHPVKALICVPFDKQQ